MMTSYLDKTQFNAERPNVPSLGLDRALGAEIADGDFRTFVLLCQLAAQEQPESAAPYTERGYADLARLHPGRQRPTAETVRGRLYRLSKAGLIRRQRAGRTTWRTYPHLDGARLWSRVTVSPAAPVQPQAAVRNQVTAESTAPAVWPERAPGTHPATVKTDDVATSVSASPRPTQTSRELVGARPENTQPEPAGWSPSLDRRVEPPTYGSLALGAAPKAIAPRIVRPAADIPPLGGYACRSQGLTLRPNPVRTLSDLVPDWKPVRSAGEEAEPAVDARPAHTQTNAPRPVEPDPTQAETETAVEVNGIVGAQPKHSQTSAVPVAVQPELTYPKAVTEEATTVTALGVQSERSQTDNVSVGAQPEHTQPEPLAEQGATVTAVGVQPEPTQTNDAAVSAQSEHTQATPTSVGVQPERTQTPGIPPVGVGAALTQAHPEAVGVSPAHTQAPETSLSVALAQPQAGAGTVKSAKAASAKGKSDRSGRQPSRARTRARASVLSGTDSLSCEKSPSTGEKTEPDSTGRADANATPRHPVLDRVDVPAGYEELAIQLATLKPEGMNYEGIAECLRQPELTRAWTEWVLTQGEGIYNPPAFIRQRVRAGQPPAAEKPIPPHQRLVRNPNRMGWDEPARADVRYVTYQSLYHIPRTQEVKHDPNPSRPAGDAHPRETLH